MRTENENRNKELEIRGIRDMLLADDKQLTFVIETWVKTLVQQDHVRKFLIEEINQQISLGSHKDLIEWLDNLLRLSDLETFEALAVA
jgi:hypothetical protein